VLFFLWIAGWVVELAERVAGDHGAFIAAAYGLAVAVFLNPVPELIYLGRSHGRTTDLLLESDVSCKPNWMEWFLRISSLALRSWPWPRAIRLQLRDPQSDPPGTLLAANRLFARKLAGQLQRAVGLAAGAGAGALRDGLSRLAVPGDRGWQLERPGLSGPHSLSGHDRSPPRGG